MAAEADAHDPEPPGASCMPRQIIETGPRIAVEGRGFLSEFEVVAAVGAGHVVGQHGAERLVLVIDLGSDGDVTLTGKKCRHPPDRGTPPHA
jgi:hypothetical protein